MAARLDIGDEFVGWLCLGSETPAWFREEDEAVVQSRRADPRRAGGRVDGEGGVAGGVAVERS